MIDICRCFPLRFLRSYALHTNYSLYFSNEINKSKTSLVEDGMNILKSKVQFSLPSSLPHDLHLDPLSLTKESGRSTEHSWKVKALGSPSTDKKTNANEMCKILPTE